MNKTDYYNLHDDYFIVISDYFNEKKYDLKHKYKLLEIKWLYSLPFGIAYCSELDHYVNDNLLLFKNCKDFNKQLTIFDYEK